MNINQHLYNAALWCAQPLLRPVEPLSGTAGGQGGSAAGHNGLKDILAMLGAPDFWRLRLGIGHPGVKAEVPNYVLKKPSADDRDAIAKASEQSLKAVEAMLAGQMDLFMGYDLQTLQVVAQDLPVVTVAGIILADVITGSFFVETVYSIPGLGRYFVDSISDRDYPVILGTVLLFGGVVSVMNLIVDLLYPLLDPRIE